MSLVWPTQDAFTAAIAAVVSQGTAVQGQLEGSGLLEAVAYADTGDKSPLAIDILNITFPDIHPELPHKDIISVYYTGGVTSAGIYWLRPVVVGLEEAIAGQLQATVGVLNQGVTTITPNPGEPLMLIVRHRA